MALRGPKNKNFESFIVRNDVGTIQINTMPNYGTIFDSLTQGTSLTKLSEYETATL